MHMSSCFSCQIEGSTDGMLSESLRCGITWLEQQSSGNKSKEAKREEKIGEWKYSKMKAQKTPEEEATSPGLFCLRNYHKVSV